MPSSSLFVFDGSVIMKRGVARGINFRNLKFQARSSSKQLQIHNASVKIFGGQVRMSSLSLYTPQAHQSPHWSANLELENINLTRASRSLNGQPSVADGLLSGGFHVQSRGMNWFEIAPQLHGEGRISLRRAMLRGLKLKRILIKSVAERLGSIAIQQRIPRDSSSLKLKTLSGVMKIRQGHLYFEEPMKSDSFDGPLQISGSMGLNGLIDLKGKLTLSAQRLNAWLRRRVSSSSSFPVDFHFKGSLSRPQLATMTAPTLMSAVASAYGISLDDPEVQDQVKHKPKEGR